MRTRQVCWHEGMMVLPHHFQSAELNLRESIAETQSWVSPYAWGIRTLELNHAALENYEIRINRLEVRLKDGTLISVPENAHLETLDVRSAFERGDEIYIYLVLPNIVAGRPNSAAVTGHRNDVVRYLINSETHEELNNGDNSREIETQRYNVQLRAQTTKETIGGFESIPLFRLRRSIQPGAVPELDRGFIPPVLSCNSFPALHQDILLAICSQIGSYIKTQALSLKTLGGWTQVGQPQVHRSMMFLSSVNSSYPYLLQLFQSSNLHPFRAYLELCRLVGQLAIFGPNWEPPSLPTYDHDDLHTVFSTVQAQIESIFSSDGTTSQILRFPFINRSSHLEVAIDSEWFGEGHEFFIGIQSELPPADLEKLFAEKHLDWKLGSSRSILQIYQNGESGIRIEPQNEQASLLPKLRGMNYFKIVSGGPYWQQLMTSPSLAVKVNDRFLRDGGPADKTITVVDENDTLNSLGLDLFVLKHG